MVKGKFYQYQAFQNKNLKTIINSFTVLVYYTTKYAKYVHKINFLLGLLAPTKFTFPIP